MNTEFYEIIYNQRLLFDDFESTQIDTMFLDIKEYLVVKNLLTVIADE